MTTALQAFPPTFPEYLFLSWTMCPDCGNTDIEDGSLVKKQRNELPVHQPVPWIRLNEFVRVSFPFPPFRLDFITQSKHALRISPGSRASVNGNAGISACPMPSRKKQPTAWAVAQTVGLIYKHTSCGSSTKSVSHML